MPVSLVIGQMVMAVFAYIYCQSFVVQPNATVDYVLSKVRILTNAGVKKEETVSGLEYYYCLS